MASSEEEEIFKRQKRLTKQDDLGNLFTEPKPQYSESESDDYDEQALNLQDVFGTGHEYDYVYEEQEIEMEDVKPVKKVSYNFDYLDDFDLKKVFSKYLQQNKIYDTHTVSYFIQGLDLNFIALHCLDSDSKVYTYDSLVKMKAILYDFPSYYKLRATVVKNLENATRENDKKTGDSSIVDNIESLWGMKQFALYQQHSEEKSGFLLSCDDFADNIFYNDNIHINKEEIDEYVLREIIEGFKDGKITGDVEVVQYFILKIASHPFLIDFCQKINDPVQIKSTLFKLLSNMDYYEQNIDVKSQFFSLVIDKIIFTLEPKYNRFLVDPKSPYFSRTVDFILNTAVKQPNEHDFYFSITEKDFCLFCLIVDYCGNQVEHVMFPSKELNKFESLIAEYSPSIVFCTAESNNFKFTYARILEMVETYSNYNDSNNRNTIKCMLIDPIVNDAMLINNERFEIKPSPFIRLEKAEIIKTLNMLLHIVRRAIYPEIEILYALSKSIIPQFCEYKIPKNEALVNKIQILEIIKAAAIFAMSIVGFDVNYFSKCNRMREIVPQFIKCFDKKSLHMLSDIGWLSNLETIKDTGLDVTYSPNTDYSDLSAQEAYQREVFFRLTKTYTGADIRVDQVVYYNLTTFLRLIPEIFNIKDARSPLDALLTHPINYHTTKMICCSSESRNELPDNETINKIIKKCLQDPTFIERLRINETTRSTIIAHCVNLYFKRSVFEGLDDENVFEMFNRGYELGKVYDGVVVKSTDDFIIVSIKDSASTKEWSVFIRQERPYDEQNQNEFLKQKHFANDQVKVKITELNVLGLSFRGEIISENNFFLRSHPLFYDCTASQAETILKTKREALLLRKSSTGEHGVIVFNLNNDIFVHYKVQPYNGKVLFNNIIYENVDQIICNFFRVLVKHQAIIESDKSVTIRYISNKPGFFEASKNGQNVVVWLGDSLRVSKKTFYDWEDLKNECL
ncbi:Transcription elongation factor SPT6 [Pseudoloma neurophilia]|uniref:Transcription elongation factor SPT6 n=1 Tax=Pseudoloma neurophilia TaxID=146866 RepID=A0A0R0M1G2_9MICR|nr:Transcription elongation factor SPT6 [Pseudoloma neurophilia]